MHRTGKGKGGVGMKKISSSTLVGRRGRRQGEGMGKGKWQEDANFLGVDDDDASPQGRSQREVPLLRQVVPGRRDACNFLSSGAA